MGSKSRGRRKGRSRTGRRKGPGAVRLGLPEQVVLDARRIAGETDPLIAEGWASGWLGRVWGAAPPGEDRPEQLLCKGVAGAAAARPSAAGAAAVAALRRVAPQEERALLDRALDIVAATERPPSWPAFPPPRAAFRGVDVWESESVLFVEYGKPRPHTLTAVVAQDGGRSVALLALAEPGAAGRWDELRDGAAPPMPVVPAAPAEVLADLAAALRETDLVRPRREDERYTGLRALAWARARPYLPDWPDWNPSPDDERRRIVDGFLATSPPGDGGAVRALAELFFAYGDGAFEPGPLAWSPGRVALFLGDHLPRAADLDAELRRLLPQTLRRWVRYALRRRGVPPRWIAPVEEAVDVYLPAFTGEGRSG
ncbi:hypothetical protein [Thermostaphylospora chromogena]|uniref:Uncharacterized protein n=1 Tax=Thermostaphylospora chromogena TaxID=35622 RepID=A0A1H1GIT4_9ACTN|nr:hypothetical protein [Thermostaphylospora chromogena]SDR13003.1 hypothetical protein SAMN04489764_3615 [Thermostaphylospora chromogena]